MSSSGGVLKSVNKYLVQAKKVDQVDPVTAYYCRLHAAQVALKMRKSKEDAAVAEELIRWCEQVAHQHHTHQQPLPTRLTPLSASHPHSSPPPLPQHKSAIAGLSKDDARLRVETFALDVFGSADVEDRSGAVTGKTATAFFAAYVFLDVCHEFGELASDVAQKMKYAAWKATEINRALKEGRTPKPGGMEEDGGDGSSFGGDGGGGDDGMGGVGGAGDGMGGFKAGGGGGGAAGGSRPMRPVVGGGAGGFVAGGRDDGMAVDRGDGGGAKKVASWQDDEDEKMAARYAATLPSLSSPSPPPSASAPPHFADDDEEEKAAPPAFNPSSAQPQPPFFPSSNLPTSYLPSAQPPPLPPQPSSHDTAHAFGFSLEGSGSPSSSAPYSPGFTGPAVPRSSLPSPQPRQQPAVPPAAHAPPSSLSRSSPAPPASSVMTPSALPPVQGKSRSQANKEAERLLKHASSALSFDDVDTTIIKLQQAVALLYPHRTPQ